MSNESSANEAQKYALQYTTRWGWDIIPYDHGTKGPPPPRWNIASRLSTDELVKALKADEQGRTPNIGIRLGPASGDLVDLDLDKPVAEKLAAVSPKFNTAPCYGHGDAPRSHQLFIVPDLRSRKILDTDGRVLLEVRAFNPDGERLASHQSVLPPSVHPDGTRYEWAVSFDPETVPRFDAETFDDLVNKLATTALIVENRPPTGGRHEWAMPLAGYLLRHLDEEDMVMRLLTGAWRAGDPSCAAATLREIEAIVEDTAAKIRAGRRVTGGRTLEKLSPGLPKAIAEVWGWDEDSNDKDEPPTDDELRDRWLEEYPHAYYSRGEWWRYSEENGLYEPVTENKVKDSIWGVLEEAKPEGVKPRASLVESVYKAILARRELSDDAWDHDPDILVVANGALKLSTRELLGHSPEHFATTGVSFPYDEDADCPRFKELLGWIDKSGEKYILERALETNEEPALGEGPKPSDLLQEFAGVSATTDQSEEASVWLAGPPSSGKSTFIEALLSVWEGRAGTLGLNDIINNPFGLASLPGKSLIVGTEQHNAYVKFTTTLKAIISGEPITINQKFRPAYQYRPTAKVLWAMEETPKLGNARDGIYRRVRVVPFYPVDKKDTTLKEDIKAEGSGILNWALDGLDRYREHGLCEPYAVKLRTEEFRGEADLEERFLEEVCIRESDDMNGDDLKVRPAVLYSAYKLWCKVHGHKPKNETNAGKAWPNYGLKRRKSGGARWWVGAAISKDRLRGLKKLDDRFWAEAYADGDPDLSPS